MSAPDRFPAFSAAVHCPIAGGVARRETNVDVSSGRCGRIGMHFSSIGCGSGFKDVSATQHHFSIFNETAAEHVPRRRCSLIFIEIYKPTFAICCAAVAMGNALVAYQLTSVLDRSLCVCDVVTRPRNRLPLIPSRK